MSTSYTDEKKRELKKGDEVVKQMGRMMNGMKRQRNVLYILKSKEDVSAWHMHTFRSIIFKQVYLNRKSVNY